MEPSGEGRGQALFDVYAFADYSGAAAEREQRKAIAWAVSGWHPMIESDRNGKSRPLSSSKHWPEDVVAACEARKQHQEQAAPDRETSEQVEGSTVRAPTGQGGAHVLTGFTRATLVQEVLQLLELATRQGKRVLFGFDHNYSFPVGFYEAVHLRSWNDWRELVHWLHDSIAKFAESGVLFPRKWATSVNQTVAKQWGLDTGPFWGPHFSPLQRSFPYGKALVRHASEVTIHERRWVEQASAGMKSVFQLGGAGAVGLQTLYGIYYLKELLDACKQRQIPVHAWPFDGWDIPANSHALIEVYPTLYVRRGERRSDEEDARACAVWMEAKDRLGELREMFCKPQLDATTLARIRLEGWVPGASWGRE